MPDPKPGQDSAEPEQTPRPNHRYEIGAPVQYTSRGFAPAPAPAPVSTGAAAPATELAFSIEKLARTLREQHLVAAELAPAPGEAAREKKDLERPTEKRAVWIVHGMGQQLPFETLDGLAGGLLRAVNLIPGHLPRVAVAAFPPASPGGKPQLVERVELDVQVRPENAPPRTCQLHLYEAYWAPLTEGAAKLSDVISFFFNAGMRGIINAFKPFRRAMFPDPASADPDAGIYRFRIPPRTFLELILTFLVLAALIAINAVIVAAGAATAKTKLLPAASSDVLAPIAANWSLLAALAVATSAIALTFGVLLFLAEMCRRPNLPWWLRLPISFFSWVGFSVTVGTIIASGALMSVVFTFHRVPSFLAVMQTASVLGISTAFLIAALLLAIVALAARGLKRSGGVDLEGDPQLVFLFVLSFLLHLAVIPALIFAAQLDLSLPHWLTTSLWVFPALGALAKFVRELFVQYPGDVAIYVDSNKLDRFDKIRKEIKQVSLDSLSAIYTARNAADTAFEYSKVAVVGHSLGSVIAYDTLNRLLILDDLAGNPVEVEQRTCLFETFGSPLDKIAYFFTIQGKETFHIREQLAAVVQPLIQSYARFRAFPWINVFSRNDIICGELKFYDVAGTNAPPAVINIVDKDCCVPLIAHVDYWKNGLVWRALLSKIAP